VPFNFRINGGPEVWSIVYNTVPTIYGVQGTINFYDQAIFDPSSQVPIVTSISPANGSTTPITNVNFSFNYNLPVYASGDQWAIQLRDLTAATSSNIYGSVSAGSHSVSITVSLTTSHVYRWTPFVVHGATSYGGFTNVFSVVSTSSLAQYFSQPDGSTAPNSGDFLGSSAVLTSLIQNVIPFSWMIQIYTAWNSVASTSSGDFQGLAINYHSFGVATTSPFGNFLPNWNAFGSTTIGTYITPDKLILFQVLMRIVLYIAAGYYMFRRTSTLIKA
jgi:hypothetical protein